MINLKKYDNTEIKNLLQLSDFSSGDGWIKFPDGTMIQSDEVTIPAGYETIFVNFKFTFVTDNVFVVSIPSNINSTYSEITQGQSYAGGITVYMTEGSGFSKNRKFTYIAIGRWK